MDRHSLLDKRKPGKKELACKYILVIDANVLTPSLTVASILLVASFNTWFVVTNTSRPIYQVRTPVWRQ